MAFGSGINERFLRIYSGNGFYMQLFQVGQPDLPGMEPAAEEAIRTDGGRMTQYAVSYISDETTPFNAIPVTFTVLAMPEHTDVHRGLGNWIDSPAWTVGAHTWTPVLPQNIGTRYNSAGVATAAIPPLGARKLLYMTNLAWTLGSPAAAATGVALYGEARGLVITNATATTEDNLSVINVEGMLHGQIRWNLTDWPAGTESIPS